MIFVTLELMLWLKILNLVDLSGYVEDVACDPLIVYAPFFPQEFVAMQLCWE